MLTFLIGGARSGKSRVAASLCSESARVAYIATARAEDDEMRARIARHRQDRPAHWTTFEEPLELAAQLGRLQHKYEILLVDCLTVWLSNFIYRYRRLSPDALEKAALAQVEEITAAARGVHLILVSNEVGSGIVPPTKVGRIFRDLQGTVNQRVAAASDHVFLMAAGIPLQIKPSGSFNLIMPDNLR
jgi:adenosylcobinamide kinase / adenosylcobinamide-phosphate guanylyltransferase